jgi:hypothetical protein
MARPVNDSGDSFAKPVENKTPVVENTPPSVEPLIPVNSVPRSYEKTLSEKLGIGGFGGFYMLFFYGAVGGGLTAYYAPKKKLLFGIGGGIATIYLISYAIRAVDYKDYSPIPIGLRQ